MPLIQRLYTAIIYQILGARYMFCPRPQLANEAVKTSPINCLYAEANEPYLYLLWFITLLSVSCRHSKRTIWTEMSDVLQILIIRVHLLTDGINNPIPASCNSLIIDVNILV